jgi:hypothetical protein
VRVAVVVGGMATQSVIVFVSLVKNRNFFCWRFLHRPRETHTCFGIQKSHLCGVYDDDFGAVSYGEGKGEKMKAFLALI